MIYFNWFVIPVYSIIIILTMVAVLMDNRQPAKALAWLMVLAFVPVAGIILYFFFGQNTRKERIIGRQSLEELKKRSMLNFVSQNEILVPESHEQLIHLFSRQGWALPFKNNDVDIFTCGREFFPALMDSFRKAKHHIHLLTYIFDDDELGRQVSDILIEKAKEVSRICLEVLTVISMQSFL